MGNCKWGSNLGNYTYSPKRGLITALITTHEPASRGSRVTGLVHLGFWVRGFRNLAFQCM